MKAKIKLLSTLFAFLFVVPCMFVLTACGGNKKAAQQPAANPITITVANKVYDGQPIEATATATGGQETTIKYKLAGEDDSTYVAEAPVNAGNYVVGAALASAGEWQPTKTAEFTISQKEIGLNWTAPANLTYNDEAKVPTVTATGLVGADVCEVNVSLNQGDNTNVTNDGFTYVATQALNANYKLPANKVSPTYQISAIVLTINAEFEYSGETTFVKNLNDVKSDLTAVYTFANKNVGAALAGVEFQIAGEETLNYETSGLSTQAIVKKEIGLNWTAPANLKFNYTAKTPTVAATGLVGSDVVTVSSSLTAANNNVFPGSFTFTATGLTGADANNYKLPDEVESSSYEITADTLELNTPVENYQTSTGVDVWFAFTTTIEGRYEILTTGVSLTASNQFVYSRVGNNIQAVSTSSATRDDVKYLSFEAAESTTYYFKVADPSANNNNTITFRGHEHLYNDYNECVFCDYFRGVDLTVNVQSDEQSVQQNEILYFRFPVKSGVYYYLTSTNFNNSNFTRLYDAWEIGSQIEIGFGEANATFPDGDGFYYLKYTATDAAVHSGTIMVHECTPNGYGFSSANGYSHYVGVTYYTTDYHNHVGDDITIPALTNGEKMYFRFEVTKDANHKYGYTKDDNLSISEIKFYVKSSGAFIEQDLTYGTTRTLNDTPDTESGKTYCYVVITSDGDSAGTIVINEVVTA